jgi:hypothetical protein
LPHLGFSDRHVPLKIAVPAKKVFHVFGYFARCISVHDFHMALNIPHVYNYITKLCRQQAEVIQNHDNEHICTIGQGKARHRKYKRLELGGGKVYDRSRAAIVV